MPHAEHRWVRGISGAVYLGYIHHKNYVVYKDKMHGLFAVYKDSEARLHKEHLGKFATEHEAKRHAEILHAMEA